MARVAPVAPAPEGPAAQTGPEDGGDKGGEHEVPKHDPRAPRGTRNPQGAEPPPGSGPEPERERQGEEAAGGDGARTEKRKDQDVRKKDEVEVLRSRLRASRRAIAAAEQEEAEMVAARDETARAFRKAVQLEGATPQQVGGSEYITRIFS